MSNLDQIVKGFYGQSLTRTQMMKWNVHHLYALYEDEKTKQKFFLRLMELPAFLHISEEIAQLYNKKYGNLLVPVKIIPIDRHFQSCIYLIRTPNNTILLSIYLQILMDCHQFIETKLIMRIFSFIIKSYKLLKENKLPLYDANQIGLSQSLQLSLCDPSLYFKSVNAPHQNVQFGVWLSKLIKQLLQIPQSQETIQQFLKNRILENEIILLIKQILKEKYTFQQFVAKTTLISKISDDATTLTSSSIDIIEYYERNTQQSLIIQDKVKLNNNFHSKFGKIIVIFIIFTLFLACSYFLFRYFNRTIICGQSQYLSNNSICLSCSDGCLRCQNSQPNHCIKCKNNMYLVLDNAQDKQGFCLAQCRGRLINMDVCIRQKQNIKRVTQQTQRNLQKFQ